MKWHHLKQVYPFTKNDKIITILSTIVDGKVQFVVGVSKCISSIIKASDIAKELSLLIDGKGGGRPDMAQGGGNNPSNIDAGLSNVEEFIINTIGYFMRNPPPSVCNDFIFTIFHFFFFKCIV